MFKTRWWVLVASFLGMACGPGPVLVFAFAVLMKPITEDLGIGRTLLSSAAIVASLAGIIGPPSVATSSTGLAREKSWCQASCCSRSACPLTPC